MAVLARCSSNKTDNISSAGVAMTNSSLGGSLKPAGQRTGPRDDTSCKPSRNPARSRSGRMGHPEPTASFYRLRIEALNATLRKRKNGKRHWETSVSWGRGQVHGRAACLWPCRVPFERPDPGDRIIRDSGKKSVAEAGQPGREGFSPTAVLPDRRTGTSSHGRLPGCVVARRLF